MSLLENRIAKLEAKCESDDPLEQLSEEELKQELIRLAAVDADDCAVTKELKDSLKQALAEIGDPVLIEAWRKRLAA